MPQVSAAGDQSPKVMVDERAEKRMEKLTGRTQMEQIAIQGLARVPRPCENILIEDGEFWTDVANVLRIGYEGETVGISTQNAIENNVIYGRLPCRYLAAG